MPDKNDFTFDDDDEFPETDLSGVFKDAEQEVPEEPDLAGPSDDFAEDEIVYGEEIEELPPPENEPGSGGSRSRLLLLILLLIVAVAGGSYYFLGGDAPSESPQAQSRSQQVVAVPAPQPAGPEPTAAASPAAEVPGATGTEAGGTVAGMAPDDTAGGSSETASNQPDAGGTPLSASSATERVATEAVLPSPPMATAGDDVRGDTARETGSQPPGKELTVPAKTAGTPTPQTVPAGKDGAYTLDAGAFLFVSQRDDLKTKIRALGYEPEETQVKASVRLIRLRVGSYSREQLPQALERAGRIAPGAFSQARDGQYVVYAGSFANQDNVQRLKARYLDEGITLVEEPVKVDKVLNQIRFGSFADDASAEEAAGKAEEAGIPARVIAVN